MRLSQVAISAVDLRRTQHWYQEVLGLVPAGGTNLFFGPLASMVQGVPRAASTCWWLVDRQEQFQIELFEFRSPLVRPLPPDWRPCDVGYTTISFWVADLDRAIEGATEAGTPPLTEPSGPGGARRVCVRDPEGVLIELMEEDPRSSTPRARPRPQVGAVARSVTLSVPDLVRSREFFTGVLGMQVADGLALHGPEHEALWGLEGSRRESLALWADDMIIELVEYGDPRGRPWPPGYRISDQGLLNIAFGFRDRAEFEAAFRRCQQAGIHANGPPLRLGAWSVVYVNDPQGFSIELLHVEPWYEGPMGFKPRSSPSVAPFVGRTPGRSRQRRRFQAALVTGASGGLGSELCRLAAEDGTRLVAMDRDREGLAGLESELGGRVEVIARQVDFSDLEAVDESAAELADLELDLVIACAGLDRAQSLLRFNWRQARDDFAVNSLSNLVLLSHLVPSMSERGAGHVTAIASLAGLVGMPYEAPYSASKAALATIVESARAELEPKGITFTAVFPGFVDTPMFRANAFRKPSNDTSQSRRLWHRARTSESIPARDAAERIYMATLERRETLAFPAVQHLRVRLAGMLPARLRDRLTREAMDPPADIESRPPVTGDLARLDATAQAELVRSGEASPAELVDAAIGRIEAVNGELNAVIHPLFDQAREAATGELPDGPFAGVPLLIKDLGPAFAGHPMHLGMQFLKDAGFRSPLDTYLAQRFREAGFITVGRTNTPELGILPTTEPDAYGATHNPWDTSRSPAGSSGGSAAAVASGMVPVAHANDGGGSIRLPASACGLVGLKPTRQRVTLGPLLGDSMSGLTADLAVSRSVRDTAGVLEAVEGPAPGDPYVAPPPARPYTEEVGADPGRLRVGLVTEPGLDVTPDPVVVAAARGAAELLESLGHSVEESRPSGFEHVDLLDTFLTRWMAGQAATLDQLGTLIGRPVGRGDVEPLTWALAEEGWRRSAAQYLAAVDQHQMMTRVIAAWHESGFDLMLTPTMGEPPTPLGAFDDSGPEPLAAIQRGAQTAAFTALFNATGQPAISLPLHWSEEGLPIGTQLIAAYGREDLLLRVAAQLEEARPWADRVPSVFAVQTV